MVYAKYRLVRQPSEQQHAAYTVGMCEIDFSFGSVFEKNSYLVQNEFESGYVWKKHKTRFVSDIMLIYYLCNSWVVHLYSKYYSVTVIDVTHNSDE